MNIGILTSSRADFGIYLPLLNNMKNDAFFNLTIIAFGTHGSSFHGHTISEIQDAGFLEIDLIQTLLLNDDPNGISTSYGLTVIKFADYWAENKYDLVFCLGDRFEMAAAVQAGVPFGIRFAHIHGGETTLGATDNIYRHQITLASSIHFPSTEEYRDKIYALTNDYESIYCVGSLGLDNIDNYDFMDETEFRKNYRIPNEQFLLVTIHPETVNYVKNGEFALNIKSALNVLCAEYILVITMPNADTNGSVYRKAISEIKEQNPDRVVCVENFGKKNYYSAMKYAKFLIGNTSSGIIEAASLGKYVLNIGDRQKGRARSKNVIDCNFDQKDILNSVSQLREMGNYAGTNIYQKENSAFNIIDTIKKINASL
jgi:GDP/UDP-N,N'-diacetylbacillosamine 2-epimerase (hydrolysing)